MSIPIPGVCTHCHATEAEIEASDSIGWHNKQHTCCSRYSCIKQEFAAQRRAADAQRQASRKRTPAEIHALIMGRGRKRKKGKAA